MSPTIPPVDGISREDSPTQRLPSLRELIGDFYPPLLQRSAAAARSSISRLPTSPASYASNPPPAKPSSSEKILRFESSNLGALHKVAFPNYRREHQEETLLHPMESSQQVFSAKSLSMKSHGQNMQTHHLALPDNPRLSQKSNSSIYNIDLSLRVFHQVRTTSENSLVFAQRYLAVIRSNPPEIFVSKLPVREIDALLGMERQKESALSKIRDELIRLNKEQGLTQQDFHESMKISDGTGRAGLAQETSRSAQQKSSHLPGAFRKPGKRRRSDLRCLNCNRSDTPEWRRGPDGPRTLCNACGLHYAKSSRGTNPNLPR